MRGSRRWRTHKASICIDMLSWIGAEAGIETRMPYLDVRMATFVLSLPWQVRLPHGDMRRLQREAVRVFLPHVVYARPIKPRFGSTLSLRARQNFGVVRSIFEGQRWMAAPFVDQSRALRALEDLSRRDPDFDDWPRWRELGQAASFETWLRAIWAYTPAERKEA